MKKFLLSLAVAAGTLSLSAASVTIDFATAEDLPSDDKVTDVSTASISGVDFSFFHCKKGTYDKQSYLQVSGKNYNGDNAAYFTFTRPEVTKSIILHTGANASVNVTVQLYAGDTPVGEPVKLATKDADFSWDIPEANQGAGVVYKLQTTNKYNAQISTLTLAGEGDVAPAAEAPVISPASTSFSGSMAVEITAAEGAKIYYTLDGTAPSAESTLYEAPIMLTQTTTVKAIAVEEGKRNSAIAEATYTLVTSYTTLKELMEAGLADTSTVVKFDGEATVAYQNGNYLYVQDATASTLIFGTIEQTYNPGDVITGFSGKMTVYNNLNELKVEAASFSPAVKQVDAPTPVEMNVEDVTAADQNKYVLLKNVRVVATTVEEKTTYKLVDEIDAEIVAYPRFADVTFPTDENTYNVFGFVSVFKEDIQIFPIEFSSTSAVESIETIDGAATYFNLQGQRVAQPAKGELLIKVQGNKATKVIF